MADLASALTRAPSGVPPRRWARLEAFLSALPPASATRLFAALETDGAGLPSASMLAALRTRLIAADGRFPPRKRTAQRTFFTPFEDFVVDGRRGKKRRARIARSSLDPIWTLLLSDASAASLARAGADYDACAARGGADLLAREETLFREAVEGAARLIAHADKAPSFREDIAARLGRGDAQAGAAALHDLAEINLLLPAAALLKDAQGAFPRPVASLTEEALYEARRLYARASFESAETAAYVLLVVAARMAAPWRALRLYYHLLAAADDRFPRAREDATLIVETLFEDLEAQARALEQGADDDPGTEDAPVGFAHFADLAAGLIDEARRESDAALVARAEACRDIAASALAHLCECSLAAMRRHHPVRHAGGSSRLMALRPDIGRSLDRLAERDARAGAMFLARAGALAEKLGRPDAGAPFAADALTEARRYSSDLIAEIRAAEGSERAAAKKRMDATLRAAEPLLAGEEIALLRERAAAAAVSA